MLYAGCFPTYSVRQEGFSYLGCPDALIEQALNYAIKTPSIKTVILSGYSALKIQVNRFHEPQTLSQGQVEKNRDILMAGLEKTFSALVNSGKTIIYVNDNPELLADPKSCVERMGIINAILKYQKHYI